MCGTNRVGITEFTSHAILTNYVNTWIRSAMSHIHKWTRKVAECGRRIIMAAWNPDLQSQGSFFDIQGC